MRHRGTGLVKGAIGRFCLIGAMAFLSFQTLPVAWAVSDFPIASSSDRRANARQWRDRSDRQLQANQFEAARQSLQRALRLYRQSQDWEGVLWSLERLGRVDYFLGNYKRASRRYQQYLALSRQVGDRQNEANALASLGTIDQTVGNYARAIDAFQAAVNFWEALRNTHSEGAMRVNLGNVYTLVGEYEEAREEHQKSLKLSKQLGNPQSMAASFNSLGAIAASQEPPNYQQSLRYYNRALALAQENGDRILEARALNNLGTIYHVQEKFAPALDYYYQSLAIARELKISELEGATLNYIGLVYAFQDDRTQALQFQEEGLAIAKKIGDRSQEAVALGNSGYTLWKLGEPAAAEKQLRAALAVSESLREGLADASKVSIVDTQLTHYDLLQQILVDRNRPKAALEIAERARARAFADMLASRLAANFVSPAGASDVFKSAFDAIAPPNLKQIRRVARDRNATLIEYTIIRDPNFIAQGKRKGNESALFIWVVQPNGKIHFRSVDLTQQQLPKGRLTLEKLVEKSREAIGVRSRGLGIVTQNGNARRQPRQQNRQQNRRYQQLYQILIQPIVDLLPSNPEEHLIFIPHDFLFLVPFPALQDPSGSYLIEQHTLLTAPSIQVLDLTRKRRQKLGHRSDRLNSGRSNSGRSNSGRLNSGRLNQEDLLIVGNPTMPKIQVQPGKPKLPLSALPGAELEAKTIAELLNVKAILGDDASESAIRQKLSNARLIHLATHGLLDNFQNGDIPGALALAPTKPPTDRPQEDGLLTASEIMELSLQAELVVLSACDTGLGDITGDGVIGLARALLAAGTPSTIVSLWSVPDAPTAKLMTAFYQQLQQTPDKAQALRQAILSTLKQHPDPKDWAAFTLIGEAE